MYEVRKEIASRRPELPPPRVEEFLGLYKAHRAEFDSFGNDEITAQVVTYGLAMKDIIMFNFQTISQYMDREWFKNNEAVKKEYLDCVRYYSYQTAYTAWLIGKDLAENNKSLRDYYKNKDSVEMIDVPSDVAERLAKAAYMSYWIFASVFIDFYNSPYGQRTKAQKEEHLQDTHKGFIKGVLECFLIGIKSHKQDDVKLICSSCQSECASGSNFCPICGKSLP